MSSVMPSLKYSCSGIAAHVDERQDADRHARCGFCASAVRGAAFAAALVARGLGDRLEQIVELPDRRRRSRRARPCGTGGSPAADGFRRGCTGTSRPLSRPSAASSWTQADSTEAADHRTTTASALLSSRSISLEKREPPWMWRSHQTSWPGAADALGQLLGRRRRPRARSLERPWPPALPEECVAEATARKFAQISSYVSRRSHCSSARRQGACRPRQGPPAPRPYARRARAAAGRNRRARRRS